MDKAVKTGLLCIAFVVLLLPLIQSFANLIEEKPLKGSFVSSGSNIEFTIANWFNGKFQEINEPYIKENTGFRNSLIRLNNQVSFSLFNYSTAKNVIVGREGMLYEEDYIKAYLGIDFIGRTAIAEKVKKIKAIQDSLEQRNKLFLVVLAPGKASFYPDHFPSKYSGVNKRVSNYDLYKTALKAYRVNYIDFNGWFRKLKDQTDHTLFPKTGIHWSRYGELLAGDSLINRIEQELKLDLPNIEFGEIEKTLETRFTDSDIEEGMNLLFNIRDYEMSYPDIFIPEGKEFSKPSFMLLGDSYFQGLFNSDYTEKVFNKGTFWYYNQLIYTRPDKSQSIYDVSYKNAILENDVIVLMNTESNLKDLGFGFVEQLHQSLTRPDEFEYHFKIRRVEQEIWNNATWLEAIKLKAKENGKSLEDMVRVDAKYVVDTQ